VVGVVGAGVGSVVGGVVGVVALPTFTRVNCWLFAFVSDLWSRRAPSSFELPSTLSASPLDRLTNFTRPEEPFAIVNCCVVADESVSCVAREPLALAMVTTLPEWRASSS
jgi:hypothetical protein